MECITLETQVVDAHSSLPARLRAELLIMTYQADQDDVDMVLLGVYSIVKNALLFTFSRFMKTNIKHTLGLPVRYCKFPVVLKDDEDRNV